MKTTVELNPLRHQDQDLLWISISKGKKILAILRDYFKAYQPSVYLPEGQTPGNPYDERSLQQLFRQAVAKAWIKNLPPCNGPETKEFTPGFAGLPICINQEQIYDLFRNCWVIPAAELQRFTPMLVITVFKK